MSWLKVYLVVQLLAVFCFVPLSFAKEIPYTTDDRERLIRLEEGLKSVNHRIDRLDKRIDALQGLMYVIITAVFAQTIGIVGFVLWDRRTALSPTIAKQKELEKELDALKKQTKEVQERELRLEKLLSELLSSKA